MDHDRSVADAALEVAASAAHTAAEVGPASSARVAPAAEAAGRAGASPAAVPPAPVGPSEQLADEEPREESGAAERHEIPARPGAEVGRGIPVRHPPSPGHPLA